MSKRNRKLASAVNNYQYNNTSQENRILIIKIKLLWYSDYQDTNRSIDINKIG